MTAKSLKKIFTQAALPGFAVLCLTGFTGCGDEPVAPRPEGSARPEPVRTIALCSHKNHTFEKAMPLTRGEINLVRDIFGQSVETSSARKYLLGTYPSYGNGKFTTHAVTCDNGKNIEFHGTANHSDDYSRASLFNYGTFIHEMTHVWQFQNIGSRNMWYCTVYDYPLDLKYSFSSYCIEQQASMVADYARHFLHPDHGYAQRYRDRDTEESFALLAKIVEDQFPAAKKTRLALNAKKQSQLMY